MKYTCIRADWIEATFMDYKSIGIFAVAFWVTWKWNLHPILLICLAGVVGLLLY